MANSNPVAVCVGMGVALLASFSLRKNHSHLCRSMRSFSKISTPIKLGMSPSEISTQQQQAALLSKFHPRFLPCVQQMANIQKDKLSSKTITVLQVINKYSSIPIKRQRSSLRYIYTILAQHSCK
jgi:hypothetical protein